MWPEDVRCRSEQFFAKLCYQTPLAVVRDSGKLQKIYLYTDDSVLGGDYSVSEGNHFLSPRILETRFNIIRPKEAHLASDISDDLGKRMVFDLSMLVPRGEVSEFSLEFQNSQPPSFRELAMLT